VWFMDDGTKSRSAVYLNTQQFTIEEQRMLQMLLYKAFAITSSFNRDKEYIRLRVSTESTKRLKTIVDPYVCPCFRYKLL
ncbi:hypothetical protein HYZ98_03410, partial [Candidatus Peregrinibacteria bacterium]|nr:hypothetical protein [Candidatus Peregrinibacteria bacterium]